MHRLFLDSTVLFAAAYSETGAARELFNLAKRGTVELVINQDVVEETERNLFKP